MPSHALMSMYQRKIRPLKGEKILYINKNIGKKRYEHIIGIAIGLNRQRENEGRRR